MSLSVVAQTCNMALMRECMIIIFTQILALALNFLQHRSEVWFDVVLLSSRPE